MRGHGGDDGGDRYGFGTGNSAAIGSGGGSGNRSGLILASERRRAVVGRPPPQDRGTDAGRHRNGSCSTAPPGLRDQRRRERYDRPRASNIHGASWVPAGATTTPATPSVASSPAAALLTLQPLALPLLRLGSTLAIWTNSSSEHPRTHFSHCCFLPKSRAHASAPANTSWPLRAFTPALMPSASLLLGSEVRCRQSSKCLQMFFGLLHAALAAGPAISKVASTTMPNTNRIFPCVIVISRCPNLLRLPALSPGAFGVLLLIQLLERQ